MKAFSNHLISVVIPIYNREKFIIPTLDSVKNQSYRPIEILLVDDGSTDLTSKVVETWTKKNSEGEEFVIKYIYQLNSGAPAARNTGIRNSKGRYLQFLDSDDFLKPEKLHEQIQILEKEQTSICLCDYEAVDQEGNILYTAKNDMSPKEIIRFFGGVSSIAPVIDKLAFGANQLLWNPNIKKYQDIDFFVKLILISPKISYCEKSLAQYVLHSEKRISNTGKEEYKNINRVILRSIFNFHQSNYKSIQSFYLKSLIALYCLLIWRSSGLGTLPKVVHQVIKTPKFNRSTTNTKA